MALSEDFLRPDGTPAYPVFDLGDLTAAGVVFEYVPVVDGVVPASSLASFDALILLAASFTADSIPGDGQLKMVARFGVGFDNVDVDACTAAGIAVAITPDGVRPRAQGTGHRTRDTGHGVGGGGWVRLGVGWEGK